MMLRRIFALAALLLLCAQSPIANFPPGTFGNRAALTPPTVTFQGAGDVVSGAIAWGSCARAYNASYANGTNPLCDLVDATTGTVAICTLRAATTGFVDLTGNYCTGTTTPTLACAAAAGGACVVKQIYDETGNGHHWSTATLAAMPALTFSALNGLPGMTCAASCVMPSNNITQTQPFSMSAVYKRTGANTTQQDVLSIAGGTVAFGPNNSANTFLIYAGTILQATSVADGSFHSANAAFNGATSTITVDGATVSGPANTAALSATPLRVGSANGGGAGLTGVMMEVGMWGVAFNSTQYGNLDTNQHGTNGYNF